jgi:hypothetical protein
MSSTAWPRSVPDRVGCRPQVDAFFEPRTCSVQYVVSDPATRACALVDPVLDYDEKSGLIGATLHFSGKKSLADPESGAKGPGVLEFHPPPEPVSSPCRSSRSSSN